MALELKKIFSILKIKRQVLNKGKTYELVLRFFEEYIYRYKTFKYISCIRRAFRGTFSILCTKEEVSAFGETDSFAHPCSTLAFYCLNLEISIFRCTLRGFPDFG